MRLPGVGMSWKEFEHWAADGGFPQLSEAALAKSGGMPMKFATDSVSGAADFAKLMAKPGEPGVIIEFAPFKATAALVRKNAGSYDEYIVVQCESFKVYRIVGGESQQSLRPPGSARPRKHRSPRPLPPDLNPGGGERPPGWPATDPSSSRQAR